ncbi:MAG: hypothetical protein Q7T55_02185 [Solirubrobacteraceae bacterium]|nr:hypothetical protein [Solirubrobacteraceae bacterium]
MRVPRSVSSPPPRRSARPAALLALLLATAMPTAAHAHGGATVVDGSSKGVTILVQRAPAQTPSGGAAVDLSTILGGPGTTEATVDYWIRPASGKTFKIETERDEGGTFHADISTANRGDAESWDVSAIVTTGDGERLRVTTSSDDPPGPDPKAAATPGQEEAPTSPTLTEGNPPTTTPEAVTEDDAAPVEDISGKSDGPPSWAFPSLLVLTIIGFAILAVRRRKLLRQD